MKKLFFIPMLLICSICYATPEITGTTGTLADGNVLTISGVNFSAKTTAAPWIWDNGEDYSTFDDAGWDESLCEPNTLGVDYDLTYNNNLTASQAHSNSTNYISGAFNGNSDVLMYVDNASTYTKLYMAWYRYDEDPWTHAPYNTPDNWDLRNHKCFGMSKGGGPWITTGNPDYTPQYAYFDFSGLALYDVGDSGVWQQIFVPPDHITRALQYNSYHWDGESGTTSSGSQNWDVGVWEKWEVQIQAQNPGDSSVKVFVHTNSANGDAVSDGKKLDFTATGLAYDGNGWDAKGVFVGGFREENDSTTFRNYFDDIYIDDCWNRVVICDTNSYEGSNVSEVQIPNQWSDTAIGITVKEGAFGSTDTAYLFVVDSDGAVSSGYEVTFGGGEAPPEPPTPGVSCRIS